MTEVEQDIQRKPTLLARATESGNVYRNHWL
jgi:hypothetical protein